MAIANELRRNIRGWGADLDLKNRPGVPRERTPVSGTGAHWDEPERQVPRIKVFVSSEHQGLTPVFGTSCSPRGLSGRIREFAYRLSEGKKAHWFLLLFADRVDVVEGALESLIQGRPHNPFSEMGLASEFRRGGFRSRFGNHRADVRRWRLEALLILGLGAVIATKRSMNRGADRRAA